MSSVLGPDLVYVSVCEPDFIVSFSHGSLLYANMLVQYTVNSLIVKIFSVKLNPFIKKIIKWQSSIIIS